MGFLEKLKNTFFEEEIVEVEEPPKKVKNEKGPKEKQERRVKREVEEEKEEEVKVELPKKIELPKISQIKKESVKEEVDDLLIEDYVEEKKEVFTEHSLTKLDTDFKYFEDEDFIDVSVDEVKQEKPHEEEKNSQPYAGAKLYTQYGNGNTQNITKQPYSQAKDQRAGFKPTPIISPIYGILDQNYTKEEIVDRKEIKPNSSYVSRKNVDLDSVRNKAFGELTQDLGLTSQEPIVIEEIREDDPTLEDNLLYDMNDVDTTPTVDKVTIADAEEYFQDLGLEYNVDYKDIKYEKANGRRARTTPAIDDIDEDDDMLPVTEKRQKRSIDDDDAKLEDNLFDLIDSMYEEKE